MIAVVKSQVYIFENNLTLSSLLFHSQGKNFSRKISYTLLKSEAGFFLICRSVRKRTKRCGFLQDFQNLILLGNLIELKKFGNEKCFIPNYRYCAIRRYYGPVNEKKNRVRLQLHGPYLCRTVARKGKSA